jgi:hypothetical protein
MRLRALITVVVSIAALASVPAIAAYAAPSATTPRATVTYAHLTLPGGAWAAVYSDGLAEVHRGGRVAVRQLPVLGPGATDSATRNCPARAT